MIVPVKKTLNNAGHIDVKLIDFSEICQKKSSKICCFLLIVSRRSFPPPPKFPVKSADFSKNFPLKILRNLTFFHWNPAKSTNFSANFAFSFAKILRNWLIFPRILIFFLRKSCEIGRFFCEFTPETREILLFFREISEALNRAVTSYLSPDCRQGCCQLFDFL